VLEDMVKQLQRIIKSLNYLDDGLNLEKNEGFHKQYR
jgi:hypothetical protein